MYSQHDEERVILKLCGENGRFLDIGAWDGVTFSNTRALAEKGWGGCLVEPSQVPYEALQKLYGGNEKYVLINAAVALERGVIDLWESEDAVSTTQFKHYEQWKNHAKFTGRRRVKAITVPDILVGLGAFNFVSIDTEGTSVDLLKSLDMANMRPTAVCVEHDQRKVEIRNYAESCGYKVVYENGENVILA